MKVNATPKRFLSVRLTSEELEEVYQLSKSSACRSLTEYVKKVLTKKPVTVKVRNQSQEDVLAALVGVKNRLDEVTEHSNGETDPALLREIGEIKVMMRQIHEKLDRE